MKYPGFFILVLAAAGLSLKSCTKDKVPVVTPVANTISFSQKVQPLIQQNCSTSGCHDAGTAQSGYNLSNYTGIRDNAQAMLNAMRGQNGFALMPPGGSIADSSILQFEAWIAQGKLDN